MSYEDGWMAVNLDMPIRVPRVEFDAEMHWTLVRKVTGIYVDTQEREVLFLWRGIMISHQLSSSVMKN